MEAGSGHGADSRPESRAKPGTSCSNGNVQRPRGSKPTLLPPATSAPVGCSHGSQQSQASPTQAPAPTSGTGLLVPRERQESSRAAEVCRRA